MKIIKYIAGEKNLIVEWIYSLDGTFPCLMSVKG